MQMLVDKIGTFVFRYGYKCAKKESQLSLRFMRGRVSSPNLSRPLFVLRVLTYISRAVVVVAVITPPLPRDGGTAQTAIQVHAVNLIEIRRGERWQPISNQS